MGRLRVGLIVACLTGVALLSETALASNVAAGLGEQRELAVPTWLFVLTGGAAIGASGLLAAFVTDRTLLNALHEWSVSLESTSRWLPARGWPTGSGSQALAIVGAIFGVGSLGIVIAVGTLGPSLPTTNLAILLTFVGVRALLPIIAIGVCNPWPAIDPFRNAATLSSRLVWSGRPLVSYPCRLRSWPAVIGLGALVFLELVFPISSEPRVLAQAAVFYLAVALVGASLVSPAVWFDRVDPLSVLFRVYGAVAPIQYDDEGGWQFVLPGSRLRDPTVVRDRSELAFVLLLIWELSFNGFVVTPPGARVIETLVITGLPPIASYGLVFSLGFTCFIGLYWAATICARHTAPTKLPRSVLAIRFGSPLIGIAAGYHIAHYLGFVISLSPATFGALTSPLSPPVNPTTLAVPGWMGGLEVGAVIVGHLFGIWAAHAVAFETFPGRLQAIRSQYPFIAVMICYTAISLWLLSLPTNPPPFVG